jgi:hypothetical protein
MPSREAAYVEEVLRRLSMSRDRQRNQRDRHRRDRDSDRFSLIGAADPLA